LIKFHKAIKNFDAPIFNTHKVLELKKEYKEIKDLKLPISVIHGDVKVNNFLFKGNKAISLIDLDMVNKNIVCWDFANFVCSWCGCENGKINKKWINIIFSEIHHLSEREYIAVSKIVGIYALEFHYRYKDYKYFNKLSKKYCDYRSKNALKFYKDFNKFIQK
jgi:thiamine kinase-like enzyme